MPFDGVVNFRIGARTLLEALKNGMPVRKLLGRNAYSDEHLRFCPYLEELDAVPYDDRHPTVTDAGLAFCSRLLVLNATNNPYITRFPLSVKRLTACYKSGIGDSALAGTSLVYLDAGNNPKITICPPSVLILYAYGDCGIGNRIATENPCLLMLDASYNDKIWTLPPNLRILDATGNHEIGDEEIAKCKDLVALLAHEAGEITKYPPDLEILVSYGGGSDDSHLFRHMKKLRKLKMRCCPGAIRVPASVEYLVVSGTRDGDLFFPEDSRLKYLEIHDVKIDAWLPSSLERLYVSNGIITDASRCVNLREIECDPLAGIFAIPAYCLRGISFESPE